MWPPLIHTLVRLSKPSGGHRLIALLHDLAKLWGVIRRPLVAEWERRHELPEFWGGAGKSSTRAVFQRRLDSEVARELGGSSVSILLDQEKCYEMVPFSCLWLEALSSEFSPTLCWMVLHSYGQPRVIKGLGSFSHQVKTKQGILAGCPMATTLLRVLYYRTLARLAQQHSSVTFGVLVDDWSIHWRTSKPHGRGLRKVVHALDDTLTSLTQLGSFPSSSKSGAICSHARVERRLRPLLASFKMKVKRHMRDLGHEHTGPYARRLVERERMAAGLRRPRLRRFRKAVGKKASVIFSAGLTSSWSHGAATMGLLPSALRPNARLQHRCLA